MTTGADGAQKRVKACSIEQFNNYVHVNNFGYFGFSALIAEY
jgi:hypothetical protein